MTISIALVLVQTHELKQMLMAPKRLLNVFHIVGSSPYKCVTSYNDPTTRQGRTSAVIQCDFVKHNAKGMLARLRIELSTDTIFSEKL